MLTGGKDTPIRRIKKNAAQCLKCLDIIESTHRHDFVRCKCGAIFIDGGKDYLRGGAADMKNFKGMAEFEQGV